MFVKKGLLGSLGLSLLLLGLQPTANAQSIEDVTFDPTPVGESATDSSEASRTDAAELANLDPAAVAPMQLDAMAESVELAQARRRTRTARRAGGDFIGIGADFGYADDVSFAVISKLSFNQSFAIRPSVLIGDDFSVLVPVTYEFSQFATEVNDFQVRPYAGVGASYSDDEDDEDLNLLLSAGADIPISQRFTLNAQANLGVFNDTDFGVTVGVGYNFGRIFE